VTSRVAGGYNSDWSRGRHVTGRVAGAHNGDWPSGSSPCHADFTPTADE